MACLAITAIFYLVIRLTIAKYALSCPLCAAPIAWRESQNLLESGNCPHCKNKLLRDC
jgi:hypothetical protein